jgi:HSP20 family protein
MAFFRFTDLQDPVTGLQTLQRELERVFDSPPFTLGLSGRGVFPPINAFSDKEGMVLHVEVPGVQPDKLGIEAHGRTLTISGSRESSAPADAGFHRRERDIGQFSRSMQLPDDVDLSRAQATYRHGILSIRVPLREESKPRQITVKPA